MHLSGAAILLVLAMLYLRSFLITKNEDGFFLSKQGFHFTEVLLVSTAISCLFYLLFYSMSEWILSFHKAVPLSEFTFVVREYAVQFDGMESFALYCAMFANITMSLLAILLLRRVKMSKMAMQVVLLFLIVAVGYYVYTVGFSPPMYEIYAKHILFPVLLTLFGWGLYELYKRNALLTNLIVVVLLAFAGLISVVPFAGHDLSYILDPALRLRSGAKVNDIYFQYDLFLSFLALGWMKLNLAISWFAYLAQVSYFLLFVGLYFLSNSIFKKKGLSVLFILSVVLLRFYSSSPDAPNYFQVTPIRLDLWIILLLIFHKKGAYHWLLGLAIGLFILFHRNLGVIYMASYALLACTLFIIDFVALIQSKKPTPGDILSLLTSHLKLLWKNLTLIAISLILCFVLFHELFSAGILTYQKIGIGMMPISPDSFYWYVPVLLSCTCSFLFFNTKKLDTRYTNTTIFIVLLAIGNSLYFFGRSHEQNILNISAILTLVLFVFFDMLLFLFPQRQLSISLSGTENGTGSYSWLSRLNTNVYFLLPLFFLFATGFFYSKKAGRNIALQYHNLLNKKIAFSLPMPEKINEIKSLTLNSPKVFFLDYADFNYYYYGGYAPVGYYSPCVSWVYKKDFIHFMQGLLNEGYYIVYRAEEYNYFTEYFLELDHNQFQEKNGMAAIKNEPGLPLLPATPGALHSTMNKPYRNLGTHAINDSFTAEIIVRPIGQQQHDAIIMNNITASTNHLINGITVQLNGDNSNSDYTVGLGTGTSTIHRAYFHLEGNKWNYLAFSCDKQLLKVYNNGKLLTTVPTNGLPFVNSSTPISIFSLPDSTYKFTGYIREVKITNGIISDSEIINTGIWLDKQLNTSE